MEYTKIEVRYHSYHASRFSRYKKWVSLSTNNKTIEKAQDALLGEGRWRIKNYLNVVNNDYRIIKRTHFFAIIGIEEEVVRVEDEYIYAPSLDWSAYEESNGE